MDIKTKLDRINTLEQLLKTAKEELEYKQRYDMMYKELINDNNSAYGFCENNRTPNKTIIKESLKMIARLSFILAKEK